MNTSACFSRPRCPNVIHGCCCTVPGRQWRAISTPKPSVHHGHGAPDFGYKSHLRPSLLSTLHHCSPPTLHTPLCTFPRAATPSSCLCHRRARTRPPERKVEDDGHAATLLPLLLSLPSSLSILCHAAALTHLLFLPRNKTGARRRRLGSVAVVELVVVVRDVPKLNPAASELPQTTSSILHARCRLSASLGEPSGCPCFSFLPVSRARRRSKASHFCFSFFSC